MPHPKGIRILKIIFSAYLLTFFINLYKLTQHLCGEKKDTSILIANEGNNDLVEGTLYFF